MHFQIYLTARAQQVFGFKSRDITHDSKVPLLGDWLAIWRCDHLVTDRTGAHACIFTNAATYYCLLVTVADSNFDVLLRTFYTQLFSQFQGEGVQVPPGIQCPTILLRGNPRTLIGVMNQQVFDAEYCLWERGMEPKDTESHVNKGIYGAPNYLHPISEFARLIKESPPFAEIEGNSSPGLFPLN